MNIGLDFLRKPFGALLVAGATLALSAGHASAQSLPRITQPVDDSQRVTLTGSTPPLAKAQFDTGAVDSSTAANHILMVLKRSSEQESDLEKMIADQHNPASANFHKWLKPGEFGKQYGVVDSDLASVTAWLQSKGFTVNKVNAGKTVIDFSGTAGQVSSAFHTELHTYVRNGVTFHANNSNPQIPAALAPVVKGLASLNDIKPSSFLVTKGRAAMDPKTHTATPQWNDPICASSPTPAPGTICTMYVPTPADIATQYSLNSVYQGGNTGAGETIGIISESNVDMSNVQNYRTFFNIGNPTNLPQTIVDGEDPGQNAALTEAYLDVEVSGALAPAAKIDLYVSADTITTTGLFTALVRAVNDDQADVLSLSYGTCEAGLGSAGNKFFYYEWQQAAAQGQSVFVSAGDSGSAGCDSADNAAPEEGGLAVSGFASTPYNVAVGGTDFYYSQYQAGLGSSAMNTQLAQYWGTGTTLNQASTLLTPIPEQPWNDFLGLNIINYFNDEGAFTIAAGSGGPSTCATGVQDAVESYYDSCTAGYPKPSWQAAPGVPADGVRDLPDVALFAADGSNLSAWPICAESEDCTTYTTNSGSTYVTAVGGTSASSPAMAGIMALVDQSQKGRQGNPNFVLYPMATQFPSAFNDVTVGSNDVICNPYQSAAPCTQDPNDQWYSPQLYPAGTGYDLASGLGSINAANLIADWSKVTFTSTTTTLALSSASITHGAPVMANVTVSSSSGTPTGSVALVTNSATPGQAGQGTVALTNGSGVSPLILPGGSYTVTGHYSGDGVYSASVSSPASITVAPEVSNVVLSVNALLPDQGQYDVTPVTSGTSLPYGYILELDATVASVSGQGTPTGQITFTDLATGTSLGTANLNAYGVAEVSTTTVMGGNHMIAATYSGDPSFNASLSPSDSFTVTKGQTYLYLQGSGFSYAGQPVIIPFNLSGGNRGVAPTGSVVVTLTSLTNSSYVQTQTVPVTPNVIDGQPDDIGAATFTGIPADSYTVNMTYAGDSNYTGITLYPQTWAVSAVAANSAPSLTALSSSVTNATTAGTFTLTSTVGGNGTVTPTGGVLFFLNGAPVSGYSPLTNGVATLMLPSNINLATGTNTAYAQYLGDATYAGSMSPVITITANEGDFSVTTPNPNLVVKSGSSGVLDLTTASLAGMGGTVSYTCTPSSPSLTCTLSSSSFALSTTGTQATTTVTINTQITVPAASSSSASSKTSHLSGWMAGSGLTLALLFFWLPAKRRRMWSALMLVVLLAGVGFSATGCGGNGAAKTPTTPTPPAGPTTSNATPGTYTVAITGTDSGVVHTLALNVTVQ